MVYPFPRPFPGPSILKSFTVLSLFSSGEQGAWYDPSDFSTMFTDAAGGTPVTAVEQPVGLLLDKSKGLALGAELVTNGDFASGTTGWSTTRGAIANVGGELQVTNSGTTYARGDQSITCVVGKWYEATAWARVGTTPVAYLDIRSGTVAGASVAGSSTSSSSATKLTLRFLANNTTMVIVLACDTGTNATAFFDNISVRELPGNHASQSTAASRPVLSARVNLLTQTEAFDNAAWAKSALSSVTANSTTAPDGTTTADTYTSTGTSAFGREISQSFAYTVGNYTLSCYAKAGTAGWAYLQLGVGANVVRKSFNLSTGASGSTQTFGTGYAFVSSSISDAGNGWYRLIITASTPTATANATIGLSNADNAASISTNEFNYLWGADLRVTNVGSNMPAYQRVAAATDYDTSGFPLYLKFDGVDDSLATGTIDFSATDKMSVFAGVRKLSDAATGIVSELSSGSLNGSFSLFAPANTGANSYRWGCGAGTIVNVGTGVFAAAPDTSALTGIGNISGDISTIRRNGALVATDSTTDQGTGNFGNYPLYIGRRNNFSLPFSGNLYSLIVRGALSTDAQIASTETYVNSKTGAY